MKFLIAGLGNIGPEYEYTRHNIGFLVVDELAKRLECKFDLDRHAFHAEGKYKGKTIHLVKPTTYMNLSGKALNYWKTELKLELSQVLVITDDIALPYGKLRLRGKGSDGGHNGLKNISKVLQTADYARMRMGIGDNFSKGRQVDYVLGQWTPEEQKTLQENIDFAAEAALSFCTIGIERTMNFFNK